jgi:hypothetical protein
MFSDVLLIPDCIPLLFTLSIEMLTDNFGAVPFEQIFSVADVLFRDESLERQHQ